jgi:mxaA protein
MSALGRLTAARRAKLPPNFLAATARASSNISARHTMRSWCRVASGLRHQFEIALGAKVLLRASCRYVMWATALLISTALTAQTAPVPSAPAAAAPPAQVIQPRAFGYVLGDLLTQRILLRDFEPAQLPPSRRVGVWFERRGAKIESSSDGRRWLAVEYQVINAPQALTIVNLPPWELESKSGQAKLSIPEWPISISPLTPQNAFAKENLSELRPDRPAPVIAMAPIRRQLVLWSAALLATLAAWFAWLKWRDYQDAANQPFARALREIHRLEDSAPQAWQALHRAFDRTADRVIQRETLASLFTRAPQLLPLRSDIERFFRQSSERFFGTGLQDEPISVRALCAELRRLEKRYAS